MRFANRFRQRRLPGNELASASATKERAVKNNSVVIVTGASQGIGQATALRLARDFSAVVLTARKESELQKTATAVRSAGAEALVHALDLREPSSVEILVKGTLDRFGRIDALVNIAGAVPQIDLFEMTDAQWEDGMALKLHGARRLTIRAWDALKASNGSVVLMSGSAALDPKPGFAAVAAVNAAIIALAKAFAEQGIKDGVQVNSVVPGAVMTGRRQSFFEKWAPAHNLTVEEAKKKFPEEVGISRFGQPEEIAELMAYLVSPAAKWMTGTSVRMDGGEIKGV
jgi:3-oxoacyl-[acyl-carrier protein] reductase